MTTETNAPVLLQISSVPQDSVKADELQLIARWKSTDKRTIPAANSKRSVIIPANYWQDDIAPEGSTLTKTLVLFMRDAVEDLARKYLSTICEDSNWARTSVNLDAFSVTNLLLWNAEVAATSGRLNGEDIANWVKASVTVTAVREAYGDKTADALGAQFVKLAGPNHGLLPEKATKLLTTLWKQEDADHPTGLRVMMRLTSISEKTVSTDDLLGSIL